MKFLEDCFIEDAFIERMTAELIAYLGNMETSIEVAVITEAENEPLSFSENPIIEIEVNFLLRLYNAASANSLIRNDILEMIKKVSAKKVKAHWARGIVEQADGTLRFDERLYRAAVWRGKQDTYSESAEKAFNELRNAMSFVSTFQAKEDLATEELGVSALGGIPIVPIASPSITAARLKQHALALSALVVQMEGGLANGLIGSALPSTACPVEK